MKEVRIVDAAGQECLRFCYIDGRTKREYLEYLKQQIVQILLALATDYSALAHDDAFDHLECVEKNQQLFSVEMFTYLSSQIDFLGQAEWSRVIGLPKKFIGLLKPGWWDEIRSRNHQDWERLRQEANQVLASLGIQYQDSIEYAEQNMHFDILRVAC
jgi:hypothetical protein